MPDEYFFIEKQNEELKLRLDSMRLEIAHEIKKNFTTCKNIDKCNDVDCESFHRVIDFLLRQ